MDEKLQNQIKISIIPAGFVLAILAITLTVLGKGIGTVYGVSIPVGLLVGAVTFGIVYMMQKNQ